MAHSRFTSALQVFEAFPSARNDITAAPHDEPPLQFLRRLSESESPENAVSFCAYLLNRREAVWWGAQCLRALGFPGSRDEEIALLTAEAWVRDPEEHRRLAALDLGLSGNSKLPGIWVAMAAGGSGGHLIVNGSVGPPVPAEMTAATTRVAVLLAVAERPIRDRKANILTCIDLCRKLLTREQ